MDTFAIQRVAGTTIVALEGDVTRQQVEAIVNSANENLQHDEGVATAVVRTGGRVIQEESNTWILEHGPLQPGEVAVTTGGMLHASHVIHAVGPYLDDSASDGVLASAVTSALDAAVEHGLRSVAFPLISAGMRGYPGERSARVITTAVTEWLNEHPDSLTEIRLVGFGNRDARHFVSQIQ